MTETREGNFNAIALMTCAIGMGFEIKCPGMKFTGKVNVWGWARDHGIITPRRAYRQGQQRYQALGEVVQCMALNGMRIPSTVVQVFDEAGLDVVDESGKSLLHS